MGFYGNKWVIQQEAVLNINKIDSSDVNKMKEVLIKSAAKNKMDSKEISRWSETYGQGEENKKRMKIITKLFESLDLGKAAKDPGDNYIVYSFKSKKFYFFDHEQDGEENINDNELSDSKLKETIDEWK